MILRRPKLLLAFDAASVQGARLVRGLRRSELQALAGRTLEAGALRPLALDVNVLKPEVVRQAAREIVAELGGAGSAILVLPDGVARMILVDVPGDSEPREYARFRLAAQLPYPAADAIVDVTPLGKGRFLAAAVRRDVAAEYEAIGAAVGLAYDRVELMPMAGLAALGRRAGSEPRIDVVLGEAAFSMAVFGAGSAIAVRSRRRDPGPDEAERIGLEVQRTAILAEPGVSPRVRVVGSGARRVAEALVAAGLNAHLGWGEAARVALPEADEMAWVGAGLA